MISYSRFWVTLKESPEIIGFSCDHLFSINNDYNYSIHFRTNHQVSIIYTYSIIIGHALLHLSDKIF